MKTSELKAGHSIFGNKGNVWNNNAHIQKNGDARTLCGVPMLSSNWARIENVEHIGCEECLKKYNSAEQAFEIFDHIFRMLKK